MLVPFEWVEHTLEILRSDEVVSLIEECLLTGEAIFQSSHDDDNQIAIFFQSNYRERQFTASVFTAFQNAENGFAANGIEFKTETQRSSNRCYFEMQRVHLDLFNDVSVLPRFAEDRCSWNVADESDYGYGALSFRNMDSSLDLRLVVFDGEGKNPSYYPIAQVEKAR